MHLFLMTIRKQKIGQEFQRFLSIQIEIELKSYRRDSNKFEIQMESYSMYVEGKMLLNHLWRRSCATSCLATNIEMCNQVSKAPKLSSQPRNRKRGAGRRMEKKKKKKSGIEKDEEEDERHIFFLYVHIETAAPFGISIEIHTSKREGGRGYGSPPPPESITSSSSSSTGRASRKPNGAEDAAAAAAAAAALAFARSQASKWKEGMFLYQSSLPLYKWEQEERPPLDPLAATYRSFSNLPTAHRLVFKDIVAGWCHLLFRLRFRRRRPSSPPFPYWKTCLHGRLALLSLSPTKQRWRILGGLAKSLEQTTVIHRHDAWSHCVTVLPLHTFGRINICFVVLL